MHVGSFPSLSSPAFKQKVDFSVLGRDQKLECPPRPVLGARLSSLPARFVFSSGKKKQLLLESQGPAITLGSAIPGLRGWLVHVCAGDSLEVAKLRGTLGPFLRPTESADPYP